MATEQLESSVLADDASNAVTTLAVTHEKPATTIELETRRLVLAQWEGRRDLHAPDTKAWKLLNAKYESLKSAYDVAYNAWQGRKLQEPARRLESNKRRAETMAKKEQDMVARIVAAVQGLAKVKDADMLTAAIADALTPPPAQKKRKKAKTAKPLEAVEEDDDDSE